MSVVATAVPATLTTILERRSATKFVDGALPTAPQLDLMLQAALTVPDHGQLRPYRFVVVQGDARGRFGDALAAAGREANPALPPTVADKLREKAFAAPTVILLIATPRVGKIPEWEQVATASCTGFAIALAAHALGLGAVWKSAPYVDGAALRETLALQPGDRLLGWVNIGQVAAPPPSGTLRTTSTTAVTHVLGATALLPYTP